MYFSHCPSAPLPSPSLCQTNQYIIKDLLVWALQNPDTSRKHPLCQTDSAGMERNPDQTPTCETQVLQLGKCARGKLSYLPTLLVRPPFVPVHAPPIESTKQAVVTLCPRLSSNGSATQPHPLQHCPAVTQRLHCLPTRTKVRTHAHVPQIQLASAFPTPPAHL